VVIGIGLNLHVSPELAGHIDQPASGLVQVSNELPERNALLAALLTELAEALPVFAEQGFKAMLAEWERNHVYHGKQVTLVAPDGSQITGVARGVNEGGELCLMTAQGERVVSIGELRLRGK
jgi:BirA family biotin operon repressor/biotin-[acetyl-CoA-carboxylase] ligase